MALCDWANNRPLAMSDLQKEAIGEICVWCHEEITVDRLGHVCNCVGPEHDDCNPDRD